MKLHLHQAMDVEETEITIRYSLLTPELERLIARIRQAAYTLPGKLEDAVHLVPLEHICYIDTVDERTFLYTRQAVYESDERLYQLEERLGKASFLRISRNTLLNLSMLKSVRSLPGERMEAALKNGERLIVSRHYLRAFKARFNL